MAEPQIWPHCDPAVKEYLRRFAQLLEDALDGRLVGLYLHGSLAMGSYYPPKSDMDVIGVVDEKLNPTLAENLLYEIALFARERPTLGDIEHSLITLETAKTVPNPTPYEIHYSSSWSEGILSRAVRYSDLQHDPDLLCHLMYVKKRGVCLFGEPIEKVFGQVSWDDFMFSILDDLAWILEDENILESPYYCILNVCRVAGLLVTGVHEPLSKDEGGLWGLSYFPEDYAPLVSKALAIYHDEAILREEDRRRGGVLWDDKALLLFRDYARSLFLSLGQRIS